jgi:D-alanyl-D-alanine carboxypeptidase
MVFAVEGAGDLLVTLAAVLRHFSRDFLRRRAVSATLALGPIVLGVGSATVPGAVWAQVGSARYSSIVVDNGSGRVMEAANADALRYPASLTKLMTLYMAFEALKEHRVWLGQRVPVSAWASSMEPSKLGLMPGTYFTVSDAILAIVTKSANDAACALGELLGGDEQRFAQMMTMRARALGMTQTTFRNASGLPDPAQTTTARDLALLAHHLIQDFPEDYHYFSEPMFYFHGRQIPNHDRMLVAYEGADGLKTGYTLASGHNLVTSAVRGQVRLIGVVLGARSNPERDAQMASLLDDGFEQLGVPVVHHSSRFRIPSLIASAEASTLPAGSLRYVALRQRGHRLRGRFMAVAAVHRGTQLRPLLAVAHARAMGGVGHHMLAACTGHGLHHGCGARGREQRKT